MRLSSIVGTVVVAAVCTGAARPVQAQGPVNIQSINLTNVNVVDGVLTAAGTVTGTFAGQPFTTDITNFTLQPAPGNGQRCAILHLELAPIDLAVLGLFVDTSEICLDITAFHNQGLLGDLLCGLADGNLGLLGNSGLLSGLSNVLTTALNSALGRTHNAAPGQAAGSVCTGTCEILDLVLGPVNLNLLGLHVKLDNCANGPVEVCVSASAGAGVLGDLLCGLADLNLLGNITLADIINLILHPPV